MDPPAPRSFAKLAQGGSVARGRLTEFGGRGGVVQKWADSGNIGTNLTIVKKRGCVANFFHSGPCACHNSVEFRALWRRTTVKTHSLFFTVVRCPSQCPGKCYPDLNHAGVAGAAERA